MVDHSRGDSHRKHFPLAPGTSLVIASERTLGGKAGSQCDECCYVSILDCHSNCCFQITGTHASAMTGFPGIVLWQEDQRLNVELKNVFSAGFGKPHPDGGITRALWQLGPRRKPQENLIKCESRSADLVGRMTANIVIGCECCRGAGEARRSHHQSAGTSPAHAHRTTAFDNSDSFPQRISTDTKFGA